MCSKGYDKMVWVYETLTFTSVVFALKQNVRNTVTTDELYHGKAHLMDFS